MLKLLQGVLVALLVSRNSLAQTGDHPTCPFPVSVSNGDFESGEIAPWTNVFDTGPTNTSIYSPGYKSKYALRIDAPRQFGDHEAGVSFNQNTTGRVCYGYYYVLSLAYNWLHYVGPPAPDYDGVACYLSFSTAYGNDSISVRPSNKPGWHTTSTVIRDIYSYCKNIEDILAVTTNCFTIYENSTGIPGYSLLVDDVKIEAIPGRKPDPPLPRNPKACENHS